MQGPCPASLLKKYLSFPKFVKENVLGLAGPWLLQVGSFLNFIVKKNKKFNYLSQFGEV
jgi:hypothetical protein